MSVVGGECFGRDGVFGALGGVRGRCRLAGGALPIEVRLE